MAVRNTKMVGNAWMYIGVPYQNRKSFARNSKGFEPLEAYFPNKPIQDSESDSDSGTEELVQQEYQRQLEARRKRLAADKKKASLSKIDSENVQPVHVNSSDIQSAHTNVVFSGANKNNRTVQSEPESIIKSSNKDETMKEGEPIHNEEKTDATLQSEPESIIKSSNKVETIKESRPICSEEKTDATQDIHQSKSTVSSNEMDVTEGSTSTLALHASSASNSEEMYSPGKSIIQRSSSPVPARKLQPSRLSFGGGSSSENESNTRVAAPLNAFSSTTQSTKQRKKRKIVPVAASKRKSVRSITSTKSDVSANSTTGSTAEDTTQQQSVTSERVSTALENDQDSVGGISTVTNSTVSFNPAKTSTQNSKKDVERENHSGARRRKPATTTKREISRVELNKRMLRRQRLDVDSDSEEEDANDTLQMLLGGAVSHMHSLQSRVAGTLAAKSEDESQALAKLKSTTAKKSKEVTVEEKPRKSARKSVNFAKGPSPSEPDETSQSKSSVSPSMSAASYGTGDENYASSHGDLAADSDDIVKKDASATKRKCFLKVRNVSIVLTKSASPDSSQGSSSTTPHIVKGRSKTSQSTKGRETTKVKSKRKYTRVQVSTAKKTGSKQISMSLRQQGDVSYTEQPISDDENDRAELVSSSDSDSTVEPSNSENEQVKRKRSYNLVRSSPAKQTDSRRQTSSRRKTRKSLNVGVDSDSDQAISDTGHFPDPVSPLQTVRDKSSQSSSSGTSTSKTVLGDQSPIDVSVLPKIRGRKRKKASRCVVPMKRHKAGPKTTSSEPNQDKSQSAKSVQDADSNRQSEFSFDSDSDGNDVTSSPGGRKYRRLRVTNAVERTPGVRRSQRTRIAPVRPWLNEKIDYEMRRKSGVSLKGVLVPMYEVDGEAPRAKAKQSQGRKTKEAAEMVDDDFQKLEFEDSMGSVVDDVVVVKTVASASKVDSRGQPIDEDAEVVVARLFCSSQTSNGLVTFSSYAEKGRCATKTYEMYFFVISGKLLFQINHQEYTVQPKMTVHVPAGSVYNIQNTQRTKAEVFYHSHAVPQDS